jgi:murein L,D-transpeptidase YcbB/YkuD
MMRAPRQEAVFLGVPALTLWLCLAGFPARAEDAAMAGSMAVPVASRLGTAPETSQAGEAPAAAQDKESADPAPGKAVMPPDVSGTAAVPPAENPGVEEAAAPPALPPVNAALKAALEARSGSQDPLGLLHRREREAIAAFYASRDFAPLWWSDGKPNPEAAPVTLRLQHAADDGLDLKSLPRFLPAAAGEEIASADLALTDAVVAYGRQASGGRVDPHMISRLIGEEPEVAEPAVILAVVASAGEGAGQELQKFNPPQQGYAALREKLLQLRHGRGAALRDPAIPGGPVLRPGMRDPRVPLIRARLSLDDSVDPEVQDLVYDTKIAAAVAGFQKANGLPPSGALTPRTVAALSGGQSSRLEAEILANMERWRWMPRDMGEMHVEVNIPDYEVSVIENGKVALRARVVVGKEETPTPIFSNTMKFLIVNPYWNVPPSIIRKEMLPKLASDPGYFQRMGYEVFTRAGHLVVRQPPGERNALGRIKFMFPNDFSVYMHDTPTRKLFAESKRAFSHGCVRVDDPFRFAETVLGRANGWSEQRVKKLIGGKERYVYLPRPLPVHLEYFTAFVDDSGELQLRDDVYGYSRRVKAALGLEGQNPRPAAM